MFVCNKSDIQKRQMQQFPGITFVQEYEMRKNTEDSYNIQIAGGKELVYEALKPFLLLFRVLGLFPLQKPKPGVTTFKIVSISTVYSFFIYILIGFGSVAFFRSTVLVTFMSGTTTFEYSVNEFNFILFLLPHFTMYPANWRQQERIANYYNSWWTFQKEYEQFIREPAYCGQHWYTYFSTFVWACVFGVYIGILNIFTDIMQGWAAVFYAYLVISLILHIVLWHLLCCGVAWTSQKMMSKFQNIFQKTPTPETVSNARVLWQELNDLTVNLGDAVGCTMLQVLIVGFITVVFTVYSIISRIYKNTLDLHVIGLTIHATIWITSLYIVCNSGHLVHQEVGAKVSKQIGKLYRGQSSLVKEELDRFLQAITSNPPIVSYRGFITVNRNLYVSICTTMVTYLVVLVQFSSQDEPHNKNSTCVDIK